MSPTAKRVGLSTFFSIAVLGLTAASAHGALVISEVMTSSGSGGTGDWFELTNTGPASVDLTGWKMDDNSFNAAASVPLAGVTSIGANSTVIFIEGAAADVTAFRTFWGGSVTTATIGTYAGAQVSLSNSGDGVTLFDATGTEVPGIRVTVGAATTGSTFTNTGGNVFVVTQAGQPGVFSSVGTPTNIGSPGVVPEPTTLALVGVAALAVRRRR